MEIVEFYFYVSVQMGSLFAAIGVVLNVVIEEVLG